MKWTALLSLLLLLPMPGDETVVARAKDVVFTRADFGDWLIDRMGVQFLDEYISSQLAARMAAERGMLPTDADVEAAYQAEFERVTDGGKTGNLETFTADLATQGYSLETWKAKRFEELRSDMCHFRLARALRVATEDWKRSRFRDLFGELGERVDVEVYFFSAYRDLDRNDISPDLAALKASAHSRAEEARAQLLAGADRATILPLTDPVNSEFVHDGLVKGYRRQMLGREIDKAVASLDEPGDISLIVDTFDGSNVLRLVVREPVRYEDVQDELIAAVMAEDVTGAELAAVHQAMWDAYQVEKVLK